MPGGILHGGEAFESCAARNMKKEVGLDIPLSSFRFITATNDIMPRNAGGHFVTIYLGVALTSEQASNVQNPEPTKTGGWRWLPWDEVKFIQKFAPLAHFVEKGGVDIARAVLAP